jgi:dipicolinate synthase subunit A
MVGKGRCEVETIGFLGGDARMAYLARMLAEDGFEVKTWSLAGAEECKPSEAMAAERVILPVPLQRDGRLNGTHLPLDDLWQRLSPTQRVYAGGVPAAARERAEALGLRLIDYYTDEALAVRNAVPTAEGAVAAAMARMSVTLHGARVLVLGFGRVGRLLARDLAALGASVTVSARRFDDFAWIDALGYRALHTRRLDGRLGAFRAIFNTVPDMVLDDALLAQLRSDCVLIELASRPGIDADAARAWGLDFVAAGGLPGKVAPETAALALREALYRIWEDET